ncbi:MAG: 1-deoxy-D-xylulose-5-phosphate synthase [Erysipelothrix sp.]|nr:1-deoxy-D-xylulose-5-phosphate synthase [Erysipelothrix sp.]
MDLSKIKDPTFLTTYSNLQLRQLSDEIRQFLIDSVSVTGGDLASNLGTVELTVILHKVFDSPKDKIIFDGGHQSYTHKILTGRINDFKTLRQAGGLSGYQKRNESVHDAYEAGHSGTALSAALGMAIARDLNKERHHIIAVVGDGGLASGMSYEALNQIGENKHPVIVIINDNNTSSTRPAGKVTKNISKLRISKSYNSLKSDVKNVLDMGGLITKPITSTVDALSNLVKKNVGNESYFSDFGLSYIGPFDGHNIAGLVKVLEYAKKSKESIVVHLKTTKGKGYTPVEKSRSNHWQAAQFDLETGEAKVTLPAGHMSNAEIVSTTLKRIASVDPSIVAVAPGRLEQLKLEGFFKAFPERSFDTGLTEDHATTLSAGLALAGKRPFLAIQSTYLQRAYDQINHDIARMSLPVVIGVDRAGLVGEDGETHQGIFDIGLLKPLPNLVIAEGKDSQETQNLLYTAFQQDQPFALRYTRGNEAYLPVKEFSPLEIGSWEIIKLVDQPSAIILTYGKEVVTMETKARENNYPWWIVNMRFIKPLDNKTLETVFDQGVPLFIYETDLLIGGLSESILAVKNQCHNASPLFVKGIKDEYIQQGSIIQQRKELAIDTNSVVHWILENS